MSGKYVPRSLREQKRKPRTTAPSRIPQQRVDTLDTPADGSAKAPTKPSPRPRPRPTPGTRPVAKSRTAVLRRRPRGLRHLRRLALRLSATAVLVLLVAGSAFFLFERENAIDRAVDEAQAEAVVAVQAIIAYDYRNFDSSRDNGLAHVTGAFAEDYGKQMDALREQATKEKAVVSAPVTGAGIVAVDTGSVWSLTPKSVDVLLYVNQTRRNDNITGEKVDMNRIVLHMVPVDGTWKAAAVTAY
ncbi:hypothetical protein AB0I28_14825 [Phytomonospora sp. NPDC050363]|uniref:hypothetical protein n=1 Tax=Phytomonospora sp. NPDC050363 TaxID=3155642 RepID=UPI0033D85D6C